MKYDDLLGVPYKAHGRDKSGMDCYGLVIEMTKRAGTPLKDLYALSELPSGKVNDYVSGGMNVRKIDAPKVGAIAEFEHGGNVHIGYIVERGQVLHATFDKGVRITPLAVMKPIAFYEVTK